MRKKTRKRSYKNTIAIGIASFASIALLSTGLAAFVLIRDAQKTVDGNFVVADVTDANITLSITSAQTSIVIDAERNDFSGRIQIDSANVGPTLTYTVTGAVEVAASKNVNDNLDLYYYVNIKSIDGTSVQNKTFEETFFDTGKFELVGGPLASKNQIIPDEGETLNKATFSFEVGLSWGEFFNYENPSVYYDGEGASIELSEAIEEFNNLKLAENYVFEIVVHANNK